MEFSWIEALRGLGPNATVRIANAVRPPERYLFNDLLPERTEDDYEVGSTTMTVRTTMAGLTGMDSTYPESGLVQVSDFKENTAKIANQSTLPEESLRKIQTMVTRLLAKRLSINQFLQTELLNFLNKVIIQAHLDTSEWLRGQALITGGIDWTFNRKRLLVDYGVPAGNFLATRTGNNHYGGSTSMFWADVRTLQRLLGWNVRVFMTHPDTANLIVSNNANNIKVVSNDRGVLVLQRMISQNGVNTDSSDARDKVTLVTYGDEAEVYSLSVPGTTVKIPFFATGKLLAVANNQRNEYRVGEGSTDDPNKDLGLGYTHVAPTVEGGGERGRWARLFTPEQMPMQLTGQGVSNILPVVEVPEKIAVATTDMA